MKIALCDDERSMLDVIEKHVDSFCIKYDKDWKLCYYFSSISELLAATFTYDVLFLDIMLQKDIDVSKHLRKMGNKAIIILITSRANRYICEYSATAFRYLIKPVSQEAFNEAMLDICRFWINTNQVLPVKFRQNINYVKIDDIIMVTSYDRKRLICTVNGDYRTTDTWISLQRFLRDKGFYKLQRGYLINLRHIKSNTRLSVTMTNDETIYLLKGTYKSFSQSLMQYLNKGL